MKLVVVVCYLKNLIIDGCLAKNTELEKEEVDMSPLVCFLNKFFREFFFLDNDIQNVPEGKA